MQDFGVVSLCEALHNNTTLKDLNLELNHFTAAGADAISVLIKHNLVIDSIRVHGNEGVTVLNSILNLHDSVKKAK